MANKQCMIQVAGTTYRIQSGRERSQVFRVGDDRMVGAFRYRPTLQVLESEITAEQLIEIARAALRAARLPWTASTRASARLEATATLLLAQSLHQLDAVRAIVALVFRDKSRL